MTNRLYVGNLPWDTERGMVEDLFGLGERAVRDVHMVTDRDSGEFRGFAFVTMIDESRASLATKLLDGFTIGQRPIRVRPAEERQSGRGGR